MRKEKWHGRFALASGAVPLPEPESQLDLDEANTTPYPGRGKQSFIQLFQEWRSRLSNRGDHSGDSPTMQEEPTCQKVVADVAVPEKLPAFAITCFARHWFVRRIIP
jgi:hypothetical protein